jgi:hypothetical protein
MTDFMPCHIDHISFDAVRTWLSVIGAISGLDFDW